MMIESLLDNDFYKITQMQIVFHQFSTTSVEYKFINRGKHLVTNEQADKIQEEINKLETLSLSYGEYDYLKSIDFLQDDFVDFLNIFRLQPRKYVSVIRKKGVLELKIKGPWLQTILFEVPILAIISEILCLPKVDMENFKINTANKIKYLENTAPEDFSFADFGTRRRLNFESQEYFISEILKSKAKKYFTGTSNIHLARQFDIKPIGTMAHEYIMAHQVLYGLQGHQAKALKNWNDEYKGKLGIALTDTISSKVFLKEFGLGMMKLFDGVRHDSGDPFVYGDMIIENYEANSIDPRTKTIVFSDGLNFSKAIALHMNFHQEIQVSAGIGTYLTNDCDNVEPPRIVIKMTKCNGFPVAKISDTPGKKMSESKNYLNYLEEIYEI